MAYIPIKWALLPVTLAALCACQPTYDAGQTVTLSTGERCSVLGQTASATQLSCPQAGQISVARPDPVDPDLRLSDIPGVPAIPPIPQTPGEAECRVGQIASGQVRGAVEGAVLDAVGLPGNLLGIIRRSQSIARRIEGQPGPVDPCAGL